MNRCPSCRSAWTVAGLSALGALLTVGAAVAAVRLVLGGERGIHRSGAFGRKP